MNKHDAINIADLSSMQDMHVSYEPPNRPCSQQSLCVLAVEQRSAHSEGLRFVSSWRCRIFLCPMLMTRQKTYSSIIFW